MLTINDLKNGQFIILDGGPFEVLSVKHFHLGRGGANVQTKIRDLRTSKVFDRNFKPADKFEEVEIEKFKVRFIYSHRDEFWFSEFDNPENRFSLPSEIISDQKDFLKPNLEITALKFEDEIINIELPIKVDYKVIEAPPGIKGNTAQGGTKPIIIETGAKVLVPLFVKQGDIIKINTQTGEYVERVESSKE